jgi:hypothetical protein
MDEVVARLAVWIGAKMLIAGSPSWDDVKTLLGGAASFSVAGYAYMQFYKWTLKRDDDNRPIE